MCKSVKCEYCEGDMANDIAIDCELVSGKRMLVCPGCYDELLIEGKVEDQIEGEDWE